MAQLPNVDDELNSQGMDNDVTNDTSGELMNKAQDKAQQIKNAPQDIKNKYNQTKENVKKAKDTAKKAKNNVKKLKNLPQKIKDTPKKIANAAKKAGKAIKDTAKKTWDGAKKVGKAIKDLPKNLKNIKELPGKLAKAAKNMAKSIGNAIKNGASALKGGLKNKAKNFLDNINPIKRVQRKIQKIKNTINKIKNAPKKIADRAKKTAKAIKNAPKKIANAAKKTVQAVKKAIKIAKQAVKLTIKAIKLAIKAIKAAIKVAIEVAKAVAQLIIMLVQFIIATWPVWVIVLVLGLIIGIIWWILDNDSTSNNKNFDEEKNDYNETTLDEEGKVILESLSGTTKVSEAFYQYFAEKSIWVVYDGTVYNDDTIEHDDVLGGVYKPLQVNSEDFNEKFMDEDGNVILKDYQGREAMFYINPNALFVYDKYLHAQKMRFPEQIVEHVAYDMPEATEEETLLNLGRFTLKQLTDDERNLNITSQKYKQVDSFSSETSAKYQAHAEIEGSSKIYIPDGDNKTIGVWDYGLGSILHYVKYIVKSEYRGSIANFQVWDKTVITDPATGLTSSGYIQNMGSYKEYENHPNKENFEVTQVGDLTGDDRLVTYKYDSIDVKDLDELFDGCDITYSKSERDNGKQEDLTLADMDAYFIDWVVTPAGDVSNDVIYEWMDTGTPHTEQIFITTKVEHKEENFVWDTKKDKIERPKQEKNSSSPSCTSTMDYYTQKVYPRPARDAEGNDLDKGWNISSKQTHTFVCTCSGKIYDCNNKPLNADTGDDTHKHNSSCPKICDHNSTVEHFLEGFHGITCTHSCNNDCSWACSGEYNYNSGNDTHVHTTECAHHYDHSGCPTKYEYEYQEEKIEETKTKEDVTFIANVACTLWKKQPYYDGEPNLDNVTGRRYYEDYLVNYDTYYPFSVTGHFNTEEMLKRIQISVTEPDALEELEAILQRQKVPNGVISNSESVSYGEGSNNFLSFYNTSEANKDIVHKIWDGLTTWGYTPEQASAVIGNIATESNFDKNNGLLDWDSTRLSQLKTFASSEGKSWTDLETQIRFICMELDGTLTYEFTTNQWEDRDEAYNVFTTSSDPGEISTVLMTDWMKREDSANGTSGLNRRNSAMSAYALLSTRQPDSYIDKVESNGKTETIGDKIGSFFSGIWGWLKETMGTIKKNITALFNFEDEYYSIMDDKERYLWTTNSIPESEVDYILQSVFAYTDGVPISDYYGKITDEFFLENFAELFSNPIGINWTGVSTGAAQSGSVTLNKKLMDTNYPQGFQKPLDKCLLSGTTSDYGMYIQATTNQFVYAACDGYIIEKGTDDRYGGSYIILSNGSSKTIYGNITTGLQENMSVRKGGLLGTVNGDELFFGITNLNNVVINPSFVLTAVGEVEATYPSVGPYKNMPRILQSQSAIGSYGYGSSTISKSGCGICAFSMIASALDNKLYSPIEVVETMDSIAQSKGYNYTYYYKPGEGSYGGVIFLELCTYYGYQTEEIGMSSSAIKDKLDEGKLVVISIKGNGSSIYTGSGHFIVIRGYNSSNGEFYVNDSAKCYSENLTYTLEELGTVKSARAIWK